jgi:O-antigen/teichoic acid export membrane protein
MRGSAWTIIAMGAQYILRLGSTLVLTRLLLPEAFGLIALIAVVMTGLAMFSDVGIASSIVRDPHGDEPLFLNTLWTTQIIRGIAIWLVATAAAYPAALLFGEAQLVELLPVAATSALFAGLLSTKYHLLRRHLHIGRLNAVELASRLIGTLTTLALALLLRSVWALVLGWVIDSIIRTALSHSWLPGPANRVQWSRAAFNRQYHFGKWIFLSSVLFFLASQADRLYLGRLIEIDMLGIYSIAVMLASSGWGVAEQLIRSVLFPAFGRVVHQDAARLPHAFYRSRLLLDLAFVGPCMVLGGCGGLLVTMLYDARYAAAGWIFQIMAIKAATIAVAANLESGLVALGQSRYCFWLHLARTTWIIAGIPLAWHLAGLTGVVWTVALSELPALLVLYIGWSRHRMVRWNREIITLPIAAAGLLLGLGIDQLIGPWVHRMFAG